MTVIIKCTFCVLLYEQSDLFYLQPKIKEHYDINVLFSAQNRKCIFSSMSHQAQQGELIVYPCSGVRPSSAWHRPPFSKIFFSKKTRQIEAKFHVEPQWRGLYKMVQVT